MNARMALFPVVAAFALLVGGCSADSPRPEVASVSSPAATSPGQAPPGGQDEFTKCMLDNGVDLNAGGTPDDEGGDGTSQGTSSPADQRTQQEALAKCREFLPDGGAPKPLGEEALQQAREFAKCMRDKGVEYPDPDPNAVGGEGVTPIPSGIDVNDPATREMMADCSRQTGGVVPGGSR